MMAPPNLFRYFLPYLVCFEMKLCITVLSSLFRYFLHHQQYLTIKMCMMILSNVFRYFLYYLVYSKQNCAFQICSATFYRIFGDKIVHEGYSKTVPLLFTLSGIWFFKFAPFYILILLNISRQNNTNNVIKIFYSPIVFF